VSQFFALCPFSMDRLPDSTILGVRLIECAN
jgi:hypothetical protein